MEVVNYVYRGNLIIRKHYHPLLLHCSRRILNLKYLYNEYKPYAKLYAIKPTQLKIKFDDTKTLLIFPSGAVRVMGRACDEIGALLLLHRVFAHYSRIIKVPGMLHLQTMTMSGNLGNEVSLYKLSQMIQSHSELELFTALRITKYNPMCVNVFASGAVVITVCKDTEKTCDIFNELVLLSNHCDIRKVCNACKYQLKCKCVNIML